MVSPASPGSSSASPVSSRVAGDGMVHLLGGGAVEPDAVAGPPGAELVAAGGELADEVGQAAVVGVAAGFDAERGDDVLGDRRPVT